MAHLLDTICFTALAVLAAFALTINATGSLPLAMLAGFIAPYPLRLLAKWLRRRHADSRFTLLRTRKKRAAETVRCWSVLRDADCRSDILALLRAAYPNVAESLALPEEAGDDAIPVYAMLTLRPLSEDAMADCLRRIREGKYPRAVIACTHDISPEARALSMLPEHTAIALIDREMLCALLAKHPNAVPARSLPCARPPKIALSRAHALKMLPVAAFLLAVYWLFGMPAYLPAGLTLLWVVLIVMKRRRAPAGLFR